MIYPNYNKLYSVMGNNFSRNINQTLDGYLATINPNSDAALVINFIKSKGVAGTTTIEVLLYTERFYTFIDQALKAVIKVDNVENFNETSNDYDPYIDIKLNGGACSLNEVTYSELKNLINTNDLNAGCHYIITDFETCYDQPDFDYNGNAIVTTQTYHVGETEPIIVFATSENTISNIAYQPAYPNDKITYDVLWDTTDVTSGPAKGRITERIDEFGNRTDYDHRNILFKRYKSYFQNGVLNGRIIQMNNGVVIGQNTNFTGDLNTGDVIMIYHNNPEIYEVTSISSTTGMTVAGFNYQNFLNSDGYLFEKMVPSSPITLAGSLYYFNDVGNDTISDGGNDMYDGANGIYTNLFNQIPYTHTQMTDPPVNENNQATIGDFVYDGVVQSGDTYFGVGSNYFTNLYPGLFVMSAYDVDITDFEIDGNLGSDGDGQADLIDYTLSFGGNDYSVYSKRVWGAQDPSVNHIYIVNTIDTNITHTADLTTEDDTDTISNLTNVTQVHYLLFGLGGGVKPTNTQIQNVVTSYLNLIDENNINTTLNNLNNSFTAITSNLPANQITYKSLSPKQNNITGDTTSYEELKTFNSSNCSNNRIGNYANLNNFFILANNVFYGSSDYLNNTFGDGCFNNTFDDDCTNNIIGNNFYNNITDDDFDDNLIGNGFYNNYITANFQRNKINYNFHDNTITNSDFYRNNIGNDFNNNVIVRNDFQNNEIGNQFNNNIIENNFYKNDIGNGYNYNKIFNEVYGNLITNGFNNNLIYCGFYDNIIGDYFESNVLGDSTNFNLYSFFFNRIGYSFTSNLCTGTFANNEIGNGFSNNTIGDGFGFGGSVTQGNKIGNDFGSNNIGEYFYNNTIADRFNNNVISDNFQLNNVKYGLSSQNFGSSTHVYGNYNCDLFVNSALNSRLSFFSGDTLTVVNITD